MRIMILTNSPAYPTTNSGYATVVKNLAPELVKLGHNVAITGMQTSYSMGSYKDIPIYPIMNDFHEANSIQAQIHRAALNIKHHKSDILLCHFQGDSFYNPFTQFFPKTVWYIPIEGEIIYKNHSLIHDARRVKTVVAQTKAGQRELAKKGIKAELVYHGVNTSVFTKHKKNGSNKPNDQVTIYYPPKRQEAIMSVSGIQYIRDAKGINFVVGYVGQNFGVRKHPELLIEAFSNFAKDKDDVMLHMHTLPRHIKGFDLIQLAEYFDISEKILFSYGDFISSGLSDEALSILYNSFDVFASATGAEGFGLCHLESMACGIPQVVPDYPPMDEFCGDNERGLRAEGRGRIFPAGEKRFEVYPESLASKMQILYDDKQLREKMSQNCLNWVKQYSWPKIAIQFDKIFRAV